MLLVLLHVEKPHKGLAGFEVRTAGADWSIWKTEMLGFFCLFWQMLSLNFCWQSAWCNRDRFCVKFHQCSAISLAYFGSFLFITFSFCSLQPDACNSDVFLPTLHHLHVYQICAFWCAVSCSSSTFALSNDLLFSFEQLLSYVDFLEHLSFIDG